MLATTQMSRLIAMTQLALPKRSIAAKVHDRVRSGLCLLCDDAQTKRGLCEKHYMNFRRRQAERSEDERGDFEVSAIREGKILPSGEARKIKTDDPFANL
jgi:hypothetical protein